jgi:hypothetical protein
MRINEREQQQQQQQLVLPSGAMYCSVPASVISRPFDLNRAKPKSPV